MGGSKHLRAAFEERRVREATPAPDPGWYERQRDAVAKAVADVERALARAREREAAIATRFDARRRAVAARYVGRPPRSVVGDLRREFEAERRALLAEAQREVAEAARAAVDLAAAADRVRATHLDPFAWLRRSRRTGAGEPLSELEAAQYRAAVSQTLRGASEVELRGFAEQAIGDRNELLAHAVANELARRDAGLGAFVKLLALPERDAADALLAEAVRDAGRALAAWGAFARQGTARSGDRTLTEALRLSVPPGAGAAALAEWHGELAALGPEELRHAEPVDPDAPPGESA